MKIKSLLVCMLAVVAISLSSCKKDDVNYAENFVGTYSMTLTPSITANATAVLSIPIPGMDGEIDVPKELLNNIIPFEDFESFDGVKCTIKETVSNSVTVSIFVENVPLFNIKGTCDEAGMHLDTYKFDQIIPAGEELGDLDLNISLGSATVAAPTNGKISWTTTLAGTIDGIKTEIYGVEASIKAQLAGNMAFAGTKQ